MDYTEVDHALAMGMIYGVLVGVVFGVALAWCLRDTLGRPPWSPPTA